MKTIKKIIALFLIAFMEISVLTYVKTGTRTNAAIIPSGTSSYYRSGDYYNNLVSALYTYANSSQPDRLVAVALSQKGYLCGKNQTEIAGNGNGSGRYCEYSEWISSQYPQNGNKRGLDWCASFVSWCAYMAGIPSSIIPHSAGAGTYRSCGTQHRIWSDDFNTYIDYQPKKGDIMLAMPYTTVNGQYKHYNGYNLTAHVAIVAEDGWGYTESGGWRFTTIERISGNEVGSRDLCTKISAGAPADPGTHYVQMFVTPSYVIPDRTIPTDGGVTITSDSFKIGSAVQITPYATGAVKYTVTVREDGNTGNIFYGKEDFKGSVTFYPEMNGKYLVWLDAISADGGHLGIDGAFTIQESGGFVGIERECSHTWVDSYVALEASVFDEGIMVQTCTQCGEIRNASIPKLEPTVSLNAEKITLDPGEEFTLYVSGMAAGDYVESVYSSNTNIIHIKDIYRIVAQENPGTAYVVLSLASGKVALVTVTVNERVEPEAQKPSGSILNIVINGKNKIVSGQTAQFDADVTVSGNTDKSVIWETQDAQIAIVTSDGFVTAINPGKTVITAKSSDENVEASYIVYVVPKKHSWFYSDLGSDGFIYANWKEQEGVSGYQIQYSRYSSFSKKVTKLIDKDRTSFSFYPAKKKNYYVRIRSYILIDSKKYYGAWKKVKVKTQ